SQWLNDQQRETVKRQREICQKLSPLTAQLPASMAGRLQPADAPTECALAEWCYLYAGRNVAAVRLYESAFAKQPSLADNLHERHRLDAACAAAQAGCGLGNDAGKLAGNEKAAFRSKALQWLEADRAAWAKAPGVDPRRKHAQAARALLAW